MQRPFPVVDPRQQKQVTKKKASPQLAAKSFFYRELGSCAIVKRM
jgi:hypothetical protein